MFCRKCGAEVRDSQAFCDSCGTEQQNTSDSTPKRSRFVRVIFWSAGILFGLVLLGGIFQDQKPDEQKIRADYVAQHPDLNTSQTASSTRDNGASSRDPQYVPWSAVQRAQPAIATYTMGQTFSVGYWSYIGHAMSRTRLLASNPYSIQRANGIFVVIDVTARNDDTSSSTLPPFKLVDQQGRTYDQSSEVMLDPGFFSVLEELNPGVSKRGNIAFDVPPDRQYSLVVSGGIESGQRAIVILPGLAAPVEHEPSTAFPNRAKVRCGPKDADRALYSEAATINIIAHVSCGENVDVIGSGAGTFQVRRGDGQVGYVLRDAVGSGGPSE